MKLQQAVEKRWYATSPGILFLLLPLEWLFRWATNSRKHRQIAESSKPDTPVIVIGNLSVGGTGKTPVIIALVKLLQDKGLKVAVVSRGYGRSETALHQLTDQSTPAQAGDEPIEIFQRCACDVVVAGDRALAVDMAIKNGAPDVILSDDGLQHYRMARDVEIVVANANQGFGNGHCLPVGPLREPMNRLQEVDFILINGSGEKHQSFTDSPKDSAFDFSVSAKAWVNIQTKERQPLDFILEAPVRAYAGIGQPQKFFSTLSKLGIDADCVAKPDHANYQKQDFVESSFQSYVMTAKDAVKCRDIAPDNAWYLEVEAELDDQFKSELLQKLQAIILK